MNQKQKHGMQQPWIVRAWEIGATNQEPSFPLLVLFGPIWCRLVLFGPKIIFGKAGLALTTGHRQPLHDLDGAFGNGVQEGLAVGLGEDAIVEHDDDSLVARAADEAADALAEFED